MDPELPGGSGPSLENFPVPEPPGPPGLAPEVPETPVPPTAWSLAGGAVGDCAAWLLIMGLILIGYFAAHLQLLSLPRDVYMRRILGVTLVISPTSLMLASLLRWLRWRRGSFSLPRLLGDRPWAQISLGALVGVAMLGVALGYEVLIERVFHYQPPDWARDLAIQWPTMAAGSRGLVVLGVAVLAPISEEFFFRGMVLRAFERSGHAVPGLLFTSALFSLMHLDLATFPMKFLVGLALGTLFLKTRSLAPSIMAHMANNSVAVLSLFLGLPTGHHH